MPSLPHALSRSTGAGVPDPCPRRERRGREGKSSCSESLQTKPAPPAQAQGREGGVGGGGRSWEQCWGPSSPPSPPCASLPRDSRMPSGCGDRGRGDGRMAVLSCAPASTALLLELLRAAAFSGPPARRSAASQPTAALWFLPSCPLLGLDAAARSSLFQHFFCPICLSLALGPQSHASLEFYGLIFR